MKKLLLIVPMYNSNSNLVRFHEHDFINRKTFAAPLQMATLAGLTPSGIETEIWDENVKGSVTSEEIDLEGYSLAAVTGFINHIRRQKQIAVFFREKRIPVVVGGVGVSSSPERYRPYFDSLFIGECERIWVQFLNDFQNGGFKSEYLEDCSLELDTSPIPKWESIADGIAKQYVVGTVQSTRGCPFSCEFCTIWTNFGRKVRTKSIEQVIQEIKNLHSIGFIDILFANDNFAGNIKYSKLLLKEIIKLNEQFTKKIRFFAEISINIARDDEFLELLAQANFRHLLIGIETPNLESLKETNKGQNLSNDLVEDCQKIMSYGMAIEGSMIVGFDNDTPDIFDIQFEFIQKACLPIVKMHLLKAMPGSLLFTRLEEEGRLLKDIDLFDELSELDTEAVTNVIPKNMTRQEMFGGYKNLLERLNDWNNYFKRLEGYILNVNHGALLKVTDSANIMLSPELIKLTDSLDYGAADGAERILKLTLSRIPNAINDIATLLIRHQIEVRKLPKIFSDLKKALEYEYV